MKKFFFLSCCVIFISCGPKVVRTSKKVIKGQWELSNISYSETGTYNVLLLNDAKKDCFVGSQWEFIPNNNTGNYTIANSACDSGSRYFIFTIQEVDDQTGLYDFLLKPTDEKCKSETNRGFRLKLASLSDINMQWQQTVQVDGEPFTIFMNFNKK